MSELRALTATRGIAAWGVVLYHIRLSIAGAPQGVVDVLAKGYVAVDFFFLLSGFVMWMSWGARLHDGGWSAVPAFLRKRTARIWPLHAVVLTGAVGLALLLAITGRADADAYPFDQLPLHLLLIHNWGLTDRLTWNVPSWSISTELFAYLAFVPLALAVDLRRVSTRALLLSLAALFGGLHLVFAGAGFASLGADIPHMGLLRCLVEFVAGTVLSALWMRGRCQSVGAIVVTAGSAVFTLLAVAQGWLPETLGVPVAFGAMLFALAWSAGMRGHPLEGRMLHYLGEISFATYLGHYLLWTAFKLAFVTDAYAVPVPLIGAYLALVFASSVALYHLVERPAQRAINAVRLPRTLARR